MILLLTLLACGPQPNPLSTTVPLPRGTADAAYPVETWRMASAAAKAPHHAFALAATDTCPAAAAQGLRYRYATVELRGQEVRVAGGAWFSVEAEEHKRHALTDHVHGELRSLAQLHRDAHEAHPECVPSFTGEVLLITDPSADFSVLSAAYHATHTAGFRAVSLAVQGPTQLKSRPEAKPACRDALLLLLDGDHFVGAPKPFAEQRIRNPDPFFRGGPVPSLEDATKTWLVEGPEPVDLILSVASGTVQNFLDVASERHGLLGADSVLYTRASLAEPIATLPSPAQGFTRGPGQSVTVVHLDRDPEICDRDGEPLRRGLLGHPHTKPAYQEYRDQRVRQVPQ